MATASSWAPMFPVANATTAVTIFPTAAAKTLWITAISSTQKIPPIFLVAGRNTCTSFRAVFLSKVPDDLPSEVAVLTEIFAVSVGLDRAKQMSAFPNESFRFDDTVVVLGVGPLGMCFLMKARMLGAGTIIAVDLSDFRLNFAKRLGADHVVNAANTSKSERLQLVKDLTHGRGADMVIECAGVPAGCPRRP